MSRSFIWPVVILLILMWAATSFAKNDDDVVVLKNGDRMTGEIKGLQRGELKFKADYMAEAVRLDWTRIERIESKSTFLISLVDGQLFTNVMRLFRQTPTTSRISSLVHPTRHCACTSRT